MAFEACHIEVETALGRKLTGDEMKQVSDEVEQIIKKFDKESQVDGLDAKVMEALEARMIDIQAAAQIEKRNSAINAMKKIEAVQYVRNTWGDDPAEGILALIGSSVVDRQGSKNGAMSQVSALQKNYLSGLTAKLAKKELLEIAASGEFDAQIWRAMWELGQEVPDETMIKRLSPEAVEIGRVFMEYNELARNHANGAGAWIKKLPGYTIRRTYDTVKLKKAAGAGIPMGDPRHYETWSNWMSENLDWEKSMPDVPQERRAQVLTEMYTQLASGVHVKFGEGGVAGFKGFGNIGKKMSHERVFHFKTPDAEFDHWKLYGQGNSLLESMGSGLRRMGRDTAIMRKLGPNAKENLEFAISEIKNDLKKKGNPEALQKFEKQTEKIMKNQWSYLSGETQIPGNATAAEWNQTIRNGEMLGDLTSAVLSAPTDLAFYAGTMRYTGERSAGTFFKGMLDAVGSLVGGIGKKLTPDEMQIMSETGIFADAMSINPGMFSADLDTPGRMSSFVNTMFKFNGLSWWQDRIRLAAVVGTGHRHASHLGKAFADLPEGMQAIFRQFDIGEEGWKAISKVAPETDSSGRAFLTPERVNELPDAAFHGIIKAAGKEVTPHRVKKAREKLVDNYRTLFSEVAGMATSEPGMMERSIMLRGTKAGTWEGEAMRHFWMYKSFTVSVMRKHLGRELWGYDAQNLSLAKAFMRMMKDPQGNSMGGMANMVVWGTLLGYASMNLKEMAKGKTPRVPTDAASFGKIFAASAMQSGSFGIYGDFLFGEMRSRFGQTPIETLLGPTARRAGDLLDIWGRLKTGDDASAKSFNFLLNNAPGVNSAYNMFYTRWAFDYLLVYRMQEMMNPGYLRRMEGRLQKEKQQEYLVPPSSVIPYGGGL